MYASSNNAEKWIGADTKSLDITVIQQNLKARSTSSQKNTDTFSHSEGKWLTVGLQSNWLQNGMLLQLRKF